VIVLSLSLLGTSFEAFPLVERLKVLRGAKMDVGELALCNARR